ncbi:hypothetical protein [Nocardioides sp. SYSU DS0651]|uniref:hypothetical protein n=1 Tax=Nocardioides sp. SYSU DS0651 TaxID=3415955 RepID=UPI003F4BDA73
MWFDGLVLRLARGGFAGEVGDETAAVADDGSAWLWVARPADGARRDLVGTFRGRLDPEHVAEARRLAASLTGAPVHAGGAPPHAVLASSAGGSLVVPSSSGGELESRLRRLDDLVTAVALESPLATVRFSARLTPGQPPQPHLVAHGEAGPVRVLITPGTSAVQWLDRDRRSLSSQPMPAPAMGLVDVDAALLDGLRRPATLAAGSAGALTVAAAPPADAAAVGLRVTGRIALRTPDAEDDLPHDPFEATTVPTALSAQ